MSASWCQRSLHELRVGWTRPVEQNQAMAASRGRCGETTWASASSSAMRAHEFTLIPWRAVIDRPLGREVMGIVQCTSVSWQLGLAF